MTWILSLERALGIVPRPADDAPQGQKTAYATALAKEMAMALSRELRQLGATSCRPDPETGRGGERRFAGGIGAKKVDVSLATEEAGLILGISIKGIFFPDATAMRSGRLYYAKNLMNRKGDLLAEATTLHKRFPYAVLGGLFLMDRRADSEVPGPGRSTYQRAHRSFRAFTGRSSPADADEKFEFLALGLCDPTSLDLSWAGQPRGPLQITDFLKTLLERVAELHSDHFDWDGERLIPVGR